MDIQRISGSGSIEPVDPNKQVNREEGPGKKAEGTPRDEVNVSNTARYLSELRNIQKQQPVRTEKVQNLANQISEGNFETPQRLDQLGDRLVDELLS